MNECLAHLIVLVNHNMGALVSTESLHAVTMHGLRLPFADTSQLCDPTMNGECLVHVQCHHNKHVLCYHNLGALVSTETPTL